MPARVFWPDKGGEHFRPKLPIVCEQAAHALVVASGLGHIRRFAGHKASTSFHKLARAVRPAIVRAD